jgi:hypothetical protein
VQLCAPSTSTTPTLGPLAAGSQRREPTATEINWLKQILKENEPKSLACPAFSALHLPRPAGCEGLSGTGFVGGGNKDSRLTGSRSYTDDYWGRTFRGMTLPSLSMS